MFPEPLVRREAQKEMPANLETLKRRLETTYTVIDAKRNRDDA